MKIRSVVGCLAVGSALVGGPLAGVGSAAPATPGVSLHGNPIAVKGSTLRLTGIVSRRSGGPTRQRVRLMARQSTRQPWHPVVQTSSGAGGAFAVAVRIEGGTQYEAVTSSAHSTPLTVAVVDGGVAPVGAPRPPAAPLTRAAIPASGQSAHDTAGYPSYPADVACGGYDDSSRINLTTLTSAVSESADISPQITPLSGWSSQWGASRIWLYNKDTGQWWADSWRMAVVTAPDPDTITVGGGPGPLEVSFTWPAGTHENLWVYTQYDWWNGASWIAPSGGWTLQYKDYAGYNSPYHSVENWCTIAP